ncbi:MAG TPA: cob(I)yrinic acid a,c-diamide adenosyltransferase [Pseudonocardiaceae bacterium]|jgi:cob(I)alamin adenosyltransferase
MTPERDNGTSEIPGSGTESVTPSATYTRTGDKGATTLGDGTRTSKDDLRIIAYGETEEASATIGLAISLSELPDPVVVLLSRVQNDLLDLGADLCVPGDAEAGSSALRINDSYLGRLERACDHFNADLPALSSFVIPGGTATSALLHHARTVVRRAERAVAQAHRELGDTVNPLLIAYLNRVSSLLFILARGANAEHGDTLWQPGLTTTCAGYELWETPAEASEL